MWGHVTIFDVTDLFFLKSLTIFIADKNTRLVVLKKLNTLYDTTFQGLSIECIEKLISSDLTAWRHLKKVLLPEKNQNAKSGDQEIFLKLAKDHKEIIEIY